MWLSLTSVMSARKKGSKFHADDRTSGLRPTITNKIYILVYDFTATGISRNDVMSAGGLRIEFCLPGCPDAVPAPILGIPG